MRKRQRERKEGEEEEEGVKRKKRREVGKWKSERKEEKWKRNQEYGMETISELHSQRKLPFLGQDDYTHEEILQAVFCPSRPWKKKKQNAVRQNMFSMRKQGVKVRK